MKWCRGEAMMIEVAFRFKAVLSHSESYFFLDIVIYIYVEIVRICQSLQY